MNPFWKQRCPCTSILTNEALLPLNVHLNLFKPNRFTLRCVFAPLIYSQVKHSYTQINPPTLKFVFAHSIHSSHILLKKNEPSLFQICLCILNSLIYPLSFLTMPLHSQSTQVWSSWAILLPIIPLHFRPLKSNILQLLCTFAPSNDSNQTLYNLNVPLRLQITQIRPSWS